MNKRQVLIAILVVFAIAVPFLNKPYHIDDTVVLIVSQKILDNPFDPFQGVINWFGYNAPVWEITTNPPFLSYYLAPFAAVSDFSEIALHAAMMLFLFLLAGAMFFLSRRFTKGSLFPLLFVMFSPAIMISGNVMRDVPATGLAAAAVALFIYGTDREDRRYLFLGAVFAGLATLTKYSSIIFLPVLLLYPFFKQKYRLMIWIWPIPVIMGLWCLHNQLMYGQIHIVDLTLNRRDESGLSWQDKVCGAFVIFSSMIYLLPALLRDLYKRRDMFLIESKYFIALAAWWFVQSYFKGKADGEYLFWAITGAVFLFIILIDGLRRGIAYVTNRRDEEAADSLFLFAWLCAPIIFSIVLVPFQAVRHQLNSLLPLMLLAFRYLEREPRPAIHAQKIWLVVLIVIQAAMAYVLHFADYEYAKTYRDFAQDAKQKWVSEDHDTWYVSHWGWQFYADRAGFKQVNGGEVYPQEGDILFWPKFNLPMYVFIGRDGILEPRAEFLELEKHTPLEEIVYPGTIPIRVMNFRGACFYATVHNNLPYRFFQDIELETMRVYRVEFEKSDDPASTEAVEPPNQE
ncbi:MAG: hypothetical protein C4527_08435 [Candidatus Omnitrophota bacterium]|jgi:hypothetical protein|nr:MAG: hypothetical protein C4527_08435 [Candidatus Omnitrophota bacterium]